METRLLSREGERARFGDRAEEWTATGAHAEVESKIRKDCLALPHSQPDEVQICTRYLWSEGGYRNWDGYSQTAPHIQAVD